MAKEKKGLTAKEETLNLIVEAQKGKIDALTDYGRKLKKDLKQCREDKQIECLDIEMSYQEELERQQSIHSKVLVMAVIGSLIFGLALGLLL